MANTQPLVCPLGARLLSQRIQQDAQFVGFYDREPSEVEKPLENYYRTPMPDGRSLLLELPGEIRNRVYQIVAATTPWFVQSTSPEVGGAVWSNKTHKMKSKSGLVCANRQINQEFCSLLTLHSPILIFKVRNFDFSLVVRYLNKLSPGELKALPKAGVTSRLREFRIVLEITAERCKNPVGLTSWLIRVDNAKKAGYNLTFKYEVELIADRPRDPELFTIGGTFPRSKSVDTAYSVINRFKGKVLENLGPGRTRQEVYKIVRALHVAAFPVFRRRIMAAAAMHRDLHRLALSQS